LTAIGLLGGTFNPPHRGHLGLALHAREELGLERVELVPAGIPPHKAAGPEPGARMRLAMCELLVADVDGISVNPIEVAREGPSFTVDTLDELHARDPDEELTFILGADTARTLASWRSPERVLRLCDLAVAVRAGSSQEDVQAAIAALDVDAARRTRFLAMGPIDVSSSQVRERAAAGLAIEQLTGAAVAGYVTEMGLYREG
jgi:nicotinate-nucleotide adenylyltransferase